MRDLLNEAASQYAMEVLRDSDGRDERNYQRIVSIFEHNLLSPSQVAQWFDVSRRTIGYWIAKDKVEVVRIGSHVFISYPEVRRMMARKHRKGATK